MSLIVVLVPNSTSEMCATLGSRFGEATPCVCKAEVMEVDAMYEAASNREGAA